MLADAAHYGPDAARRGSDFMLAATAHCGSDAARHGSDFMLTDAARCGSDAARYGSDLMLADATRCGSGAARCGSASCDSEYIEDNDGGAPACAESKRYWLKGDIHEWDCGRAGFFGV